MLQSHLFSTTRRQIAASEEAVNAVVLPRGGYIEKTAAGAYSYLPLGLRVIRKISQVVREEMDTLPHTSEVQMTVLQPKDIWMETGRWDDEGMREVMYRLEEPGIGLGATHEENVTDLFRKLFSSYKQLPIAAYQINTKFRAEARPKSGLLRGREFLMKDLYSFHADQASMEEYYELAAEAYLRVYGRLGLNAVRTKASGGVFSTIESDEFQVIAEIGEDLIYLNADGTMARNKEVVEDWSEDQLKEWGGGEIRAVKAIEAGNIFHLETKYTSAMKAEVNMEDGSRLAPLMGCYGIGISRVMGIIAEIFGQVGDANGRGAKIVWPESVAPYAVHVIGLGENGLKEAHALYQQLRGAGVEVLFDDRAGATAGEKFADADLIGSPKRVVVSDRSLAAGGAEVSRWSREEAQVVALGTVLDWARS